jgi:putative ABC transport system substrate-binding protein
VINRRTFLAGTGAVLLAAPLAAAQQARKVYKIGYLAPGLSSASLGAKDPFRQGLRDLGYVEGRDFVMEYRWAEGHPERLPELAADLVRAQVDVIVTAGTLATYAAMQATKTIPIVFGSAGSVVEKGIVASLTRSGGNVTGLTFQLESLKLYQLLKEAAPRVARGVYLYDPDSGSPGVAERLRSQAQAVNVKWQSVALRDDPNGVAQAFAEFGRGTYGLVLDPSTPLLLKADQICGLALQRRIPAVGRDRRFADAGCLMSYAEDLNEMYRRAAGLVDRILKGAKPADLPIEMSTKFELVINLKTAKALGLTTPPSLLQRADQIIK